MTREEALKKIKASFPYGVCMQNEDLIKEIYDSFENQKCENCIHYINYHQACREEVVFYGKKKLPKDFGCNKWEANDEQRGKRRGREKKRR